MRAWEIQGLIYEKESAFSEAAQVYEMAWQFDHHRSPTVGYKLAFNYLKAKRYLEAINVCHLVLAVRPLAPRPARARACARACACACAHEPALSRPTLPNPEPLHVPGRAPHRAPEPLRLPVRTPDRPSPAQVQPDYPKMKKEILERARASIRP